MPCEPVTVMTLVERLGWIRSSKTSSWPRLAKPTGKPVGVPGLWARNGSPFPTALVCHRLARRRAVFCPSGSEACHKGFW